MASLQCADCKVVFISRARVQIAKKQFNHVNNEYEISFDQNTEVEPVSSTALHVQTKLMASVMTRAYPR
jgi:ssDNA-binding replication factor A large subunit